MPSSVVDIALGALLLVRRPGVVAWVKVRVIGGAIPFSALHSVRGDPVMGNEQSFPQVRGGLRKAILSLAFEPPR